MSARRRAASDQHTHGWQWLMDLLRREYAEARPHQPGVGRHHVDRPRPYTVRPVGLR